MRRKYTSVRDVKCSRIVLNKYVLYINNLKYLHLTTIFRTHNIHLESAHTNSNDYCVPKTLFYTRILNIFDVQI